MNDASKSKSVSFPALTKAVYTGLKHTAQGIPDRCRNERLYVMGLWLSPTYAYVGVSYNSEEALDRAAKSFGTDEAYDTHAKVRALLKWNPDDWEYHENKSTDFDDANVIMERVSARLRSIKSAYAFQNYVDKVDEALVKALLKAQCEGIFDEFGDKDSLVLALVQGNSDPKWFLKNARKLISRDAYTRLRDEVMPKKGKKKV